MDITGEERKEDMKKVNIEEALVLNAAAGLKGSISHRNSREKD